MDVPIIRLEVERMKHTLMTALLEHQAQLDADVKAAIDEYCTPENIGKVIRNAAHNALDYAIKEEVEKFLRYGDGRKAVAAAVRESILKNETYTALDKVD